MATKINYSELKAHLLKFYQLYEQVFEYYFREVNIYDINCPMYVTNFLTNLKELKQEWENLLNVTLGDVVAAEMDLSKFDEEFKDTNIGIMLLNTHMQSDVIAQFFSYSRKKEYRPYYDLWKLIEICDKSELRIFDYMCRKPVTDCLAQARIVKAVYDVELKTKSIGQPESTLAVENELDENGCLLATAIIVGLFIVIIPAYLFAAFSVGDTSEEFPTWFAISYIIFAIIFIPLGYFSAKYGDGETYSSSRGRRSKGYSFWSVPRGRSLTAGWKIKKYDPAGWRKKNGTNLFKQSGRRKSWF